MSLGTKYQDDPAIAKLLDKYGAIWNYLTVGASPERHDVQSMLAKLKAAKGFLMRTMRHF